MQPSITPQPCDTLLCPSWILPILPRATILEDHAIAMHHGTIVALGPREQMLGRFAPQRTVMLPHHVVLPGFVNAHSHAAMVLLRSLGSDKPLHAWLQEHMWPAETALLSHAFIASGTRLAAAEMIKGGTTAFNEHYFFPEAIVEAVQSMGLRARVGLPVIDVPTPWASGADEALDLAKQRLSASSFGPNDRMGWAMAPHAPYTLTPDQLQRTHALAAEHTLPFHIHLHETDTELEHCATHHQQRPVALLQQLGVLDRHTVAVHMVHSTPEDWTLLKAADATVVTCPKSNLKLASGFPPVHAMLQHGLHVAIGTDGAASNNSLSMLDELRLTSLVAKAVANNSESVCAHQALEMATIGGARALGWEQHLGSLEVGKQADMIAVDLHHLATYPHHDPAAQLVYAAHHHQIQHVWVAGEALLTDGKLVRCDEASLLEEAASWQAATRHYAH